MWRILICVAFLLAFTNSKSQTYISLAPSLSNTAGTLADKTNISIDVGRQWGVFSLGLIVGKKQPVKNGRKRHNDLF